MTDTRHTLLSADELAGVNGGLLTSGEVPVAPTPKPAPGGVSSGQGATMGGQWNWGGGQLNGRQKN